MLRWKAGPTVPRNNIAAWLLTIILLAIPALRAAAQSIPGRGEPFGEERRPLPHRVFASSKFSVDRILAHPYDPDVPFGSSGDRIWATSPQGWAFREGVNYLYFTNSNAYDLKVTSEGAEYFVGPAYYTPSHVHVVGQRDNGEHMTAEASFTYATDGVERPLTKPFNRDKRWTCWNSGRREDWYTIKFGKEQAVASVDLYFYDDQPVGGCAPPDRVTVETFHGGAWHPVDIVQFVPKPDRNIIAFVHPERANALRFTLHHRGSDKYTGLYGVDPQIIRPAPIPSKNDLTGYLKIEADKWISTDDALVTRVVVKNPTKRSQSFSVQMISPLTSTEERISGETKIADFPYYLRGGGSLGKARGRTFNVYLKPRESTALTFALVGADSPPQADATLARTLSDPDPLRSQTLEYQAWFDRNAAGFECSDGLVNEMYWHRWYNVKKNSMYPRLGKLQHRTFSEGRWTADWYANVISYGAGHQIREARWLRDPSYAWGHLQTWTENPRPDGIFPSHVTPKGQQGGQYTDWIGSTAWDTYMVHPDKTLLAAVADPVARNAEAWRSVYGKGGSPLLVVDSHWWTGMEWQPSFFSFADYNTGGGAGTDPSKMTALRRVDLTAYNFGNALAAANIYRALGRSDEAARLQKLADETRDAVDAQMWDTATHWFHSLRASDDVKSPDKEIIGLYPFYFDMPPKNQGYETAWERVFDPKQFWTKYPLASVDKDCPAYSQNGWPVGPGGSGCMWNGPSWPHANSLVMTAMANVLRHYGPSAVTKKRLYDLFHSFTEVQFRPKVPPIPWTGEFYNGDTGEWKTQQRDYNHSTWIDPLISDQIGLVPRADNILEIDSLLPDHTWSYYLLDGQAYRGHDVTIAWDEKGGHFDHEFKGYAVYLDGKKILTAARPTHVLYDMSAHKLMSRN